MDQSEDREEGLSASKPDPCEEYDDQTRAHRPEKEERTDSPPPSCVSMKSDWSMGLPLHFKGQHSSATKPEKQERTDSSPPSCVSMKSDWSMGLPLDFKGQCSSETKPEKGESTDSPPPSCVSMKSDWSMGLPLHFKGQRSSETKVQEYSEDPKLEQSTNLDSIFMILKDNIVNFVMDELKNFQHLLSQDPETLKSQKKTEEVDAEDKVQKRKFTEAVLNITLHYMRKIKQEELADRLLNRTSSGLCQRKLKSHRKKKFRCVFEGIAKAGNPSVLNQIYTELYITEGESSEVNDEHEVRQIEAASRKTDELEKKIKCENIFKAEMTACRNEPIRTVMTKGVAGIGKTVLTQKFTLDWAEDKANQDIHFIFPFTFRELNVVKKRNFSLVELVHHFFTETKEICSFEEFQVVFIFDGLDECRPPLDFHNTEILTDVTESTSVDVLLTNLIRGKLLPSARLWITTRPAAANQIPPECVDMVTEVRGFTDPQKEEYFRKRFRDEEQASSIISHIKTSRSLHIMCHIPVFCWIAATVLEDELKTRERGELPKTLTEMYIHFLVVQTKEKKVKYDGGAETDLHWSPETRKMIESLGKLAFDQLQKGNLIFYESDLTECGIDIRAASVYSGVFTQFFKEERGLYQGKVFCFAHLSVQEFLAALHVHMTFINHGVNLWFDKLDLDHLHQCAVVKALRSPNGHLDLFLRFLLGLSVQTSQNLLHGLVKERGNRQNTTINTAKYIKKKISEDLPTERSLNLFHCLNELKDESLTDEVQCLMSSGRLSVKKLSPAQWSALVFTLLSSEKDLDEFDFKKFFPSNDVLLRMLQVIKSSRRAVLSGCNLSKKSCGALALVLSSQSSCLRELDLSDNDLKDSGVKLLCDGLKSPHCLLETLRLSGCQVTKEGCSFLASALTSNPSHLRELDLSYNHLGDSGVKLLSDIKENPHWRLDTLRLSDCNLSKKSCGALASVLSSQSSCLRELDLSDNDLKDSGVKLLSDGLKSPHCLLETLSLSGCQVTEEGCSFLASALTSNPSHLRELDLSYNHLGDSGVKLLFDIKENPHWRLDTLRLSDCNLSERSCEALASVLSSQSSCLRELDLSGNDMKDSGVENLSDGLKSPNCLLETLSLSGCQVTKEGCYFLASALTSNPSHLRELDMSYNHLGDSGVKLLSDIKENPDWRLDTLKVDHGGEQRMKPGLRKYAHKLTLDPNTANWYLLLSNNNTKAEVLKERQPYDPSPERFDVCQVLCTDAVTDRCYWEVEWEGDVLIAVTYKTIRRRGNDEDCRFGNNNQSWSLRCSEKGYSVCHNKTEIKFPSSSSFLTNRVSVYVNYSAGTISFYEVFNDKLLPLQTFHSTFTEPLYPGFGFGINSSVSICEL
ncbi:NACHT, LRR and PYD domains-containing protein 12-like isoform X1 [Mugil cephalus]|uniref:NACHT, LRR and PYD domains-containing protein 12-like isoform X1 n=1 Tax=Mugil cephalus TaxID=48193 RepID=UPI001FB5908C|nr:NACHT, LRR and PYD domains-containing protein 12-like isoform X1 [Mugil cephalus]